MDYGKVVSTHVVGLSSLKVGRQRAHLRVELDAVNLLGAMRETHDDVWTTLDPGCDLEASGQVWTRAGQVPDPIRSWKTADVRRRTCRFNDETVVGDHLNLLGQASKKARLCMRDRASLTVLDLLDVANQASEGSRDALMTQADAQDGDRDLTEQLGAEAKVFASVGSARSRREDDAVEVREDVRSERSPVS